MIFTKRKTYHGILDREFAAVSQTSFCSLRYFRANLQPVESRGEWRTAASRVHQCKAFAKQGETSKFRETAAIPCTMKVSEILCEISIQTWPRGRSFKQIMASLDRCNDEIDFSPFCFRHVPLCLDRSFSLFFFFVYDNKQQKFCIRTIVQLQISLKIIGQIINWSNGFAK